MDWSSINNAEESEPLVTLTSNELEVKEEPHKKNEKYAPEAKWQHMLCLYFLMIVVYTGFTLIGVYARPGLPKIEKLSSSNDVFSEERALSYTKQMTDLHSRVCTSSANQQAQDAIISQLRNFQQIITTNKLPFELNYFHDYHTGIENGKDYGDAKASWHYNMTFIAARLMPTTLKTNSTVNCTLFSSHIDSLSDPSEGATDDAAAVGLELELLRTLMFNDPGSHCHVFFFSACEEIDSVSTAAFVENHPWAQYSKTFVTYENNGILEGPQLLVRQSGRSFITSEYFKHAHRFKANSYVHNLGTFSQDHLDTYSILSHGNRNPENFSYWEFTKKDNFNNLKKGSLQFLGNNLVPFFLSLADNNALDEKYSHSPSLSEGKDTLFFDFLGTGLFLTRADFLALAFALEVLHLVGLLGALFVMARRTFKRRMLYKFVYPLTVATFGALLSFGLGLAVPTLLGAILSLYNPLFWYSKSYLAFMLYSSGSLFAILLVQALANVPTEAIRQTTKRNIPRFSFAGISVALAILILIGMGIHTQLGLFVLIFGFFTFLTLVFEYLFTRLPVIRHSRVGQDFVAGLSLMLNLSVPSWILITTWNDLSVAVLPVMTHIPPYQIGALFGFFATLYLFPIIPIVRRAQFQKWALGLSSIVMLVLFIAASFVEPYDSTHPRRLGVMEVQVVQNSSIHSSYFIVDHPDSYDLKSDLKKLDAGHVECHKSSCNITISHPGQIAQLPQVSISSNGSQVEINLLNAGSGWQEIMLYTSATLLEYRLDSGDVVTHPERQKLDWPVWRNGHPDPGYLIRLIHTGRSSWKISLTFNRPSPLHSRTLFWFTDTTDNYKNLLSKVNHHSNMVAVAQVSSHVVLIDS